MNGLFHPKEQDVFVTGRKVAKLKTVFWNLCCVQNVIFEIFRIHSCQNVYFKHLIKQRNPGLDRQIVEKTSVDFEQRRHVAI